MDEKKLLVYAPDKGENDTGFRWLSIADVQDYWHLIHIVAEDNDINVVGGLGIDAIVADVSIGDFIEFNGEIIDGQFISYKTSDVNEIENLNWKNHDEI